MNPMTYAWQGGSETLLRFGPKSGPLVLAAMPPFEEANRTRAFMVTVLRALSARGISTALPDLPGSGDSLVPTEQAALGDWRSAFRDAARALRADHGPVYSFAIRGGALLDMQADVAGRYHFAPVPGAKLVREMLRTRLAATKEAGEHFDAAAIDPPGPPIELAGNRLSRVLLAELAAAAPVAAGTIRTVRLEADAQPADLKLAGAPLWRRAEPGNDLALAMMLADDIAAWVVACGG
jgi:hypothetical protein